ncbi:MAG TPA: uracil phosphoribosyltransferase, partial [Acidimicrobiaceae bacterium]|nr:uracil phosphoribosyltransferase [Acidimicrobiaceae bacterium]
MIVFSVVEHPVVTAWTDRLRSIETGNEEFRRLLQQIGQLM